MERDPLVIPVVWIAGYLAGVGLMSRSVVGVQITR
jgi:hypothetical protein